jgi:hypothetical protein
LQTLIQAAENMNNIKPKEKSFRGIYIALILFLLLQILTELAPSLVTLQEHRRLHRINLNTRLNCSLWCIQKVVRAAILKADFLGNRSMPWFCAIEHYGYASQRDYLSFGPGTGLQRWDAFLCSITLVCRSR